jgi:hypothetical protein
MDMQGKTRSPKLNCTGNDFFPLVQYAGDKAKKFFPFAMFPKIGFFISAENLTASSSVSSLKDLPLLNTVINNKMDISILFFLCHIIHYS